MRLNIGKELSHAFGKLVTTTVENQQPVIGDIYMEISPNDSKELGQHFTPWSVCQMTAKLDPLTDSEIEDIKTRGPNNPIKIHDPACGSGRLPLAKAKQIHSVDPSTPVIVTGVDLNKVCAQMAVINLALTETPGIITHGNSLTMDHFTMWEIHKPQTTEIVVSSSVDQEEVSKLA